MSQEARCEKFFKALLKDNPAMKVDALHNYRQAELRYQKEEAALTDLRQNTKLRRHFSWAIFGILSVWITAILVLVFLLGFGVVVFETSVIIAVLTSTTVSIIGIFLGVVAYLFPKGDS